MCRASVSHRFTLSCFPGGCFFDLRVRGRWLSFQAEGDFPAVFVSFHGDQEGTAERPAWRGPHVPGADVGSAAVGCSGLYHWSIRSGPSTLLFRKASPCHVFRVLSKAAAGRGGLHLSLAGSLSSLTWAGVCFLCRMLQAGRVLGKCSSFQQPPVPGSRQAPRLSGPPLRASGLAQLCGFLSGVSTRSLVGSRRVSFKWLIIALGFTFCIQSDSAISYLRYLAHSMQRNLYSVGSLSVTLFPICSSG